MITCALCAADCTGHAVEFTIDVGGDEADLEIVSLCPPCAEPWRGPFKDAHEPGLATAVVEARARRRL